MLEVKLFKGAGGTIACKGPCLKNPWKFCTAATLIGFPEFSESSQELEAVTIAMKFLRYLCNMIIMRGGEGH